MSSFSGSALILIGAFWAIREQGTIVDDEFLRSMIPHAGAILTCGQAPLTDDQVRQLCGGIAES